MFAVHTTQITNILFFSHLVLSDLMTMFFKLPRICRNIEKCILQNIYHHKNSKYFSALFFYHRTGKFMYKKVLFANGLNILFKSKVALSHINMVFPKISPGKVFVLEKMGIQHGQFITHKKKVS